MLTINRRQGKSKPMQAAQLSYPQAGFANIPNRLAMSASTLVVLPTIEEAWLEVWAPHLPEMVCAACGHTLMEFRPGYFECLSCDVIIDLRDD